MDSGVTPDPSTLVVIVDDVAKTPTSVAWDDGTHVTFSFDEVALGPAVVTCRYSTKDPDFRSNLDELVTPFDMAVTAP